ncbi:hypothetical protein [Streptomyces sp. NBC_00696]|uniref:hypothetical protein n=1 Tax=Streptomyces sp. NBC_00696 TaxID=2903672 RepID=UPI002E2F17FB|nr:hypothetical protein [Streptomyces sp. NBC_00696]
MTPVDIGGWQLASFTYTTDPQLPLAGTPGVPGDLLTPHALHEMHGFDLLRRPPGSVPVPVDDDQPRELVWPLLAPNRAFLTHANEFDARRQDQLARAADHFFFAKCHVLGDSGGTTTVSPCT